MPMTVFEGDEASAADSGNGLGAGEASLGEEFSVAFSAVWFFVLAGESLTCELVVAVGASEAFSVPWFILVSDSASLDDFGTFDTPGGELLFVAASAIDFLFSGDEALGADGGLAGTAREALFVPLTSLVFHLLGSCTEDLAASVASRSELGVVAVAAIDFLRLRSELLVDEGHSAFAAQEAGLVPVFVFVRQVLGVNTD